VIVGDKTVSAPEIGLMWARSPVGAFEHLDAVTYCEGMDTAGFEDWRLPTIDELESILAAETEPAWYGGARVLWSATPHEVRGVETLVLPGGERSRLTVGVAHVLCVRYDI
jgi:hypothetical protein